MNLKKIKDRLSQELHDVGQLYIQESKENLKKHNLGGSELYDSIELDIQLLGTRMVLSISMNDYWKWVENGRSSGKFPPPDKIREWIDRKGIKFQPRGLQYPPKTLEGQKKTLTFLISRKISREGVKGRPFLPDSPEDGLKQRLEDALWDEIQNDVTKRWKQKLQ